LITTEKLSLRATEGCVAIIICYSLMFKWDSSSLRSLGQQKRICHCERTKWVWQSHYLLFTNV